MAIMTREEFQTLSKKIFSKRNGTILEIDNALDAYHRGKENGWDNGDELDAVMKLRDVVHKFDREKEQKYMTRASYHIRKQQSSKRRIAVEALRQQVYGKMWELYNPRRRDTEIFLVDDHSEEPWEALARDLESLRISVRETGQAANDLRSTLHGHVEAWFNDEGIDVLNRAGGEVQAAWAMYYKNGAPKPVIRLGTVDLIELLDDHCMYLQLADASSWDAAEKTALGKMRFGGDDLVGTVVSKHPPVEMFPQGLRDELEAYLRELLANEMHNEVDFVRNVIRDDTYYRAVVHLDYYAFRELENIGLHKDTVGNTLFVALHYMNDGPMMGPEYVDDPAPIQPEGGDGFYRDNIYLRKVDRARHGAPWAKVRDVAHVRKYVWPSDLLLALQAARRAPERADYIQDFSELRANGLVTFVDELVFHATPSMMVRKPIQTGANNNDNRQRYISSGATISGLGGFGAPPLPANIFGERTYQSRIARRLSVALNRNPDDLPPADSGSEENKVRRFWRVWLSIVPRDWYQELRIE